MNVKKLFLPAFAACAILFSACPIGMDYTLGTPGTEKIDNGLVGTWSTDETDAEVVKVSIKKADDYSYSIEVIEKGSMYSLDDTKLKGWVTEIDNHKFLYCKPEGEDKYYLYSYKTDAKNQLTIYDVSLKVNGVDGVKSTDDYRKEVSESLKLKDCLTEPRTYTKE